ncbi:MAG TPA: hypothetical protein VN317_02565 [Candidatus Methanoperedens sp.]|nr:hypothetical protein [Candidatus Methanoperedens sp.]
MKALVKYLSAGISVMFMAALLVGCAKPPTQEMDAAKVAIDAAVSAGAGKYANEGLKSLNDAWAAAQDEVKKQEGKLFKNYDNAKAMIAKVTSDAAALKTEAVQKKEAAKQAANADAAAATAAIAGAKALLAEAPTGKGTKAEIEALKADLAGIEGSVAEINTLIASEEYFAASDKAKLVSAKAAEISAQVQAAIDKAPKGKKKK